MLETKQPLERLNQVLIERQISISDVVSVIEHPGGALAFPLKPEILQAGAICFPAGRGHHRRDVGAAFLGIALSCA